MHRTRDVSIGDTAIGQARSVFMRTNIIDCPAFVTNAVERDFHILVGEMNIDAAIIAQIGKAGDGDK